jgi:short-subunit dehydrogenase
MSSQPDFASCYGPWALIAGASEGIGAAFARQIAGAGVNVALLARRRAPLDDLAKQIRAESNVEVRSASIDLTSPTLLEDIAPLVAGLPVGLLVYNAGGERAAGNLVDRPLEDALHMVDLNCRGPVLLAHRFGREMAARGRGGIILLTSLAAGAGGGYLAAYCASKAFDRTLAEALWVELGQRGVDVLSLVAGLTDTPNVRELGLLRPENAGATMSSDAVAAEGLAALAKGPVWVAGEGNRAMAPSFWGQDRAALALGMSQANATMFHLPLPERPPLGPR